MAKAGSAHDLVTGASGFIGRRLCAALVAGAREVTAVMRAPAQGVWQQSVLLDLGTEPVADSMMRGIDTVYHLAARVHEAGDGPRDSEPYHRVNVDGTRHLLEAAARAGVRRFVYFSSIKAMGEFTAGCDDESATPAPVTPYGRTKRGAESLLLESGSDVEGVVLRLPAVYGPGSKGNVAAMLEQVRRGRFPPLPEFHNPRSMVHVDDVVAAARIAARHPRAAGQVFIVTDANPVSTRELYLAMCDALGRAPPRWRVPGWALGAAARAGDWLAALTGRRMPLDSAAYEKLRRSACYSSRRMRRELGFEPRHTLNQGLREMLEQGQQ